MSLDEIVKTIALLNNPFLKILSVYHENVGKKFDKQKRLTYINNNFKIYGLKQDAKIKTAVLQNKFISFSIMVHMLRLCFIRRGRGCQGEDISIKEGINFPTSKLTL